MWGGGLTWRHASNPALYGRCFCKRGISKFGAISVNRNWKQAGQTVSSSRFTLALALHESPLARPRRACQHPSVVYSTPLACPRLDIKPQWRNIRNLKELVWCPSINDYVPSNVVQNVPLLGSTQTIFPSLYLAGMEKKFRRFLTAQAGILKMGRGHPRHGQVLPSNDRFRIATFSNKAYQCMPRAVILKMGRGHVQPWRR